MATTHTLGGRVFREAKRSTIEHDIWTMDQIWASGLDSVRRDPEEAFEEFGLRLLDVALRSGRALDLIGGLVVPEEVDDLDWTPQLAKETARFLGQLSSEEDKQQVHVLLGKLVAGFFPAGVLSAEISPVSSASQMVPSGSSETVAP